MNVKDVNQTQNRFLRWAILLYINPCAISAHTDTCRQKPAGSPVKHFEWALRASTDWKLSAVVGFFAAPRRRALRDQIKFNCEANVSVERFDVWFMQYTTHNVSSLLNVAAGKFTSQVSHLQSKFHAILPQICVIYTDDYEFTVMKP